MKSNVKAAVLSSVVASGLAVPALLSAAIQAGASPLLLPTATISGCICGGTGTAPVVAVTSSGTTSNSSTFGGASETGSVTISNSPTPSLSANVTATGGGTVHNGPWATADTYATYTYFFDIVGDPSLTSLLVGVKASGGFNGGTLSAGTFDTSVFSASLLISSPDSPYSISQSVLTEAEGDTYNPGPASQSFSVNGNYTLSTNTVYSVAMTVSLISSDVRFGTDTFSAYVDPTFTINTPGFTIDYSLAPTSATPLPAALPLFASGFGVIGFLAKRRKPKGAALAAT
jgi:hypothetical protein